MSILITDQTGNSINLSFPPKRIISLVPSQTELLYDLGLDEEVIGITKFCIHPKKWFQKKQRIGGTKTVKTSVVKALKPDIIIANKEENVKAQIEELGQIAPVYVSDIRTLNEALEMILSVGKLVNKEDRACLLVRQIKEAFESITPAKQKINTAYFIWKDPYMAAGGDTFIHDMLSRCGLTNVFQNLNRYPEVTINSLAGAMSPSNVNCQSSTTQNLLLLSSEPYPFKQKHLDELHTLLPFTKILLVDGEMFSWYGSRLLYAPDYFKNLISEIHGKSATFIQ